MRHQIMQKQTKRKLTAWIATLAILFVMLFSSAFIAHHVHHECSGEDCPICYVLEQCSNNLRNVGTALVVAAASVFVCLSIQENVQHTCGAVVNCSLISQKVRLNN